MSLHTPALSASQQAMVELWDKRMGYEFASHSVSDTMDTMVEFPINLNVPVMTGGIGYAQVQRYYAEHFIPKNPRMRRSAWSPAPSAASASWTRW